MVKYLMVIDTLYFGKKISHRNETLHTAAEDSILLMGTGEPLNEPVVSHGPFVMNNQTQLLEAFRDYQMGKMGVLIED